MTDILYRIIIGRDLEALKEVVIFFVLLIVVVIVVFKVLPKVVPRVYRYAVRYIWFNTANIAVSSINLDIVEVRMYDYEAYVITEFQDSGDIRIMFPEPKKKILCAGDSIPASRCHHIKTGKTKYYVYNKLVYTCTEKATSPQ